MKDRYQNNAQKFIDILTEYGDATNNGDSKRTNKLFDRMVKIYAELKLNPIGLLPILIENMNAKNEYVSYLTSFLLLEFNPELAKKKLIEISKKNGFAAFEAEWTLKEWKNGSIEFPPYK